MPSLSFFLATTDHPIDDSHRLWKQPLPHSRHPEHPTGESTDREAVTYGSLFSSVKRFCEFDAWRRLLDAISFKLDFPVTVKDLEQVSVFLEKHGAFYHPVRLQIRIRDRHLSFVVNVAASDRGRKALPKEVKALQQLNAERPFGWLPAVYGVEFCDLPMFLGDWFEGFHEFHLTREKGTAAQKITVWDGAFKRRLLTPEQTSELYRSAAMILTGCYDPISTRQIFPWHHAAGDFVVRTTDGQATTRLITVREYAPIRKANVAPDDEKAILDALLVFFIHLSIRMRLDRIDGVSKIAWAPDDCLAPVTAGFFQGLDLTARIAGFPESFPDLFRLYVGRLEESDVLSVACEITATVFDRQSEESGVIESHLGDHIVELMRIFSN